MIRRAHVVVRACTRNLFAIAATLFANLTMSSGRGPASSAGGPVVRCGHLKKLKTMKKKYFVLRGEAPGCLACLEYYDSKKKFENRQPPKRSILLHSCFNINKRGDTKHKHVIALYTKDECFCLILDSEKELEEWLKAMLRLQSGDVPDGEQPRPTFGKSIERNVALRILVSEPDAERSAARRFLHADRYSRLILLSPRCSTYHR